MAYRFKHQLTELRQAYRKSKKNKAQLAREANIQRSTVYAFLYDNENKPTVDTLEKIARALGVNITVEVQIEKSA